MKKLREEMRNLSNELVRSRKERIRFVQENKKQTSRLLENYSQQREKSKQQVAKETRQLSTKLSDFNRANKRSVARSLKELGNARARKSSDQQSARLFDIEKIQRQVRRLLQENQNFRKRAMRQHARSMTATLNNIRNRVAEIRKDASCITKRVSDDMQAASNVWLRTLAEQPLSNRPVRQELNTTPPAVSAASSVSMDDSDFAMNLNSLLARSAVNLASIPSGMTR